MFKKIHVFRDKPEREVLDSILNNCQKNGIKSGIIIGIIGSVQNAQLNFLEALPGKYDSVDYEGPLEIIAAQGSVAVKDNELIIHVHLQLAGQDICSGGHLARAMVFSTAEVTLGELDYQLRRQEDSYTGLNELVE